MPAAAAVVFNPILDIVYETMPRDNLLNSACLELFEFIKRENMKDLTLHLVERYRDRLKQITYVETFKQLIDKYEKYLAPSLDTMSFTSVETESTPNRGMIAGGQPWRQQGLKDVDAEEEAYYNGSDHEEDDENFQTILKPVTNGASPMKPLVDYPDDEDETMDLLAQDPDPSPDQPRETTDTLSSKAATASSPPERLVEKRRREEDDEDELSKIATQQTKRRSSSISSVGSNAPAPVTHGHSLRRKKSISNAKDGPPKKISIALAVKSGNGSADGE